MLESVEVEGDGIEFDRLDFEMRCFFRLLKISAISESTLFNSRFMPVQDC